MLSLEVCIAGFIVIALNLYMVLGGADYGGGVWDLFASGPRARQQRNLIDQAIGPVWEANHVWLILALTVLFTAFPLAFATITSLLHIPLLLLLIGIVFRGSAFAFRSYGPKDGRAGSRWGVVFSVSSLLTPVFLGTVLGSIASGKLLAREPGFSGTFVKPWLAPFPIAVGLFAVVLFAFLAAVYLTVEAPQRYLREDFRRRALLASGAAAVMAVFVILLGERGAPQLYMELTDSAWTWPLIGITVLAAGIAFTAVWTRRYKIARIAAVIQASLILWGWALAQFPRLIMPDLSLYTAASPRPTLVLLAAALGAGAVILLPSFAYLLWIFKSDQRRVTRAP